MLWHGRSINVSTIESKNLVVAVKSYSRGSNLPLDASSTYDSLADAQTYAQSPTAYAGQIITVKEGDNYNAYILDGEASAYTLTKVGLDASAVKNYVQVVTELPKTGQEQGVVYINTTDKKGSIWNGTAYVTVFEQVDNLQSAIDTINTKLDAKADKGDTLAAYGITDAYTKSETNTAIANAVASAGHLKRLVVDKLPEADSADKDTIYMVPNGESGDNSYEEYIVVQGKETPSAIKIHTPKEGAADDGHLNINGGEEPKSKFADEEVFRVGEFTKDTRGNYSIISAVGDSTITISASQTVVPVVHQQLAGTGADKNGSLHSAGGEEQKSYFATGEAFKVGEYTHEASDRGNYQLITAVGDTTITIGVPVASGPQLMDAGVKKFEKIGDTAVDLTGYAKTSDVTKAVDDAKTAAAIDAQAKADKALTDAKAYSDGLAKNYDAAGSANQALTDAKTYADTQDATTLDSAKSYTDTALKPISDNLNTKVDQTAVDKSLSDRIGDIDASTTVKAYIDTAVGSGGTASAEAIATAKKEAIAASNTYTDTALTITEF